MGDSIEEQIRKIQASAPTIEYYLAPRRARIAELQRELAKAKTRPKRQAISRELKKHIKYVSLTGSRKREKRPSARQLKRQKAEEEKLAWLVRKVDKNRA